MNTEWIKFEDKLPTNLPNEQVNILFCSPKWTTYIIGLYTHNEELSMKERLSFFNQENYVYIEWLSQMPTHYYILPNKPTTD